MRPLVSEGLPPRWTNRRNEAFALVGQSDSFPAAWKASCGPTPFRPLLLGRVRDLPAESVNSSSHRIPRQSGSPPRAIEANGACWGPGTAYNRILESAREILKEEVR
jgi:hypothetical protein